MNRSCSHSDRTSNAHDNIATGNVTPYLVPPPVGEMGDPRHDRVKSSSVVFLPTATESSAALGLVNLVPCLILQRPDMGGVSLSLNSSGKISYRHMTATCSPHGIKGEINRVRKEGKTNGIQADMKRADEGYETFETGDNVVAEERKVTVMVTRRQTTAAREFVVTTNSWRRIRILKMHIWVEIQDGKDMQYNTNKKRQKIGNETNS